MKELMPRREAISHIVTSALYWAGDTIDNSYYSNNLGLERAFEEAVNHVKNCHGAQLTEDDIREAKKRAGLK